MDYEAIEEKMMDGNEVAHLNIDASGRGFPAPEMSAYIRNAVEDTFRAMIKEGAFRLFFPAEWGHYGDGFDGPRQPGNIIYMTMDIDPGMDATALRFDLFEMIKDSIALHEVGDGEVDEDGAKCLGEIRSGLLKAIDMIDGVKTRKEA
jgi:hypothetical protein